MGVINFLFGLIVLFVVCILGYRYSQKNGGRALKAGGDAEFKEYCAALNNTEMHNLIISGGRSSDRFLAITRILNEASTRRIPTIVLHSGFSPFNQFSQNTYFDPCIGTDSNEIAEILTDAATNALNIDNVIHSSLKLIVDLLQATRGDITLSDVIGFPYDDVIGYLDECKDNNSITDNQYVKFKQRYNNPAIKDNILKVAPLIAKLKPLAQKSKVAKPINFQQAVADRQILFFDLLTDSNTVLKELIFAAINKLTEVSKFWVITEGISFIGKPDSKVDTVFVKNRNNITLVYSGDDVPALTSQTENTFETLTGGNSQLLLFAHNAPSSAKKWSQHFAEEYQEKQTENRSGFLGVRESTSHIADSVIKYPPQYFMQSARTKDINNRFVVLGLKEGECYFAKGNMLIQTQAPKNAFMALAGSGSKTKELSKISLQPTQLAIESISTAI